MKYDLRGDPIVKFGKKRSFNILINDPQGNPKPLRIFGYLILGAGTKYPRMIVHRDIDRNYKQTNEQGWRVSDFNTGLTLVPSSTRFYNNDTRKGIIACVIDYLDNQTPETIANIKSRFDNKYQKIN